MKVASKGKKLWVPDEDTFFHFAFESGYTKKVLKHIEGRGSFLDVGGNVGLWSIRLAEHFRKGYIVEPVAEHIDCIRENFREYTIDSVEVIPYAASDVSGEVVPMMIGHSNSGQSSLEGYVGRQKSFGYQDVELKRLDDIVLDRNITFVKMDVEGHEVKALRGMTDIIEKCKPVFFVEVLKRNKDKENAVGYLLGMGYEIVLEAGENYLMRSVGGIK